jgi:hypothetical protein
MLCCGVLVWLQRSRWMWQNKRHWLCLPFLFLLQLTEGYHSSGEEIIDQHSYWDRLKKSKSDVLVGVILLIFIPFFLWMIERQVVRYQLLISRCQSATREVHDPFVIKSSYQGRPILVKGLTAIDESSHGVVRDSELGYQPDGGVVRLRRTVEMYQWVEQVQEDDDQTRYSYDKGWYEEEIDSESFRDSSYHNPSRQPHISSLTKSAEAVYLGAYLLSSAQVERLQEWKPCPIPAIPSSTYSSYHHLFPRIERSSSTKEGGYVDYLLFNGGTLHSPEIGTVRVSYQLISAGNPITTVGVQTSNTFRPFYFSDAVQPSSSASSCCCPSSSSSTHAYRSIDEDEDDALSSASCCVCFSLLQLLSSLLSRGIIGSEVLLLEERLTDLRSLFRDEKRALLCRLFLVRLVSYLLLAMGVYLIVKPVATLLSFIPFFGSLLATALWLVSLLVGFTGGILLSSCAWVAYRPSILAGEPSSFPPSLTSSSSAAVLLTIGGACWISAVSGGPPEYLLTGQIICGLSGIPLLLSLMKSIDECRYHRHLAQLDAEEEDEKREQAREGDRYRSAS